MVTITKEGDSFIFQVQGWHQLWAFKNKITVPSDKILDIHQDLTHLNSNFDLRMPGTHVPYLIKAGTYYNKGKKNFWDVCKRQNSIVVELKDCAYDNLVIEVPNPTEAISLLKSVNG